MKTLHRHIKAFAASQGLHRNRDLFAVPCPLYRYPFPALLDRWRWGDMGYYVSKSRLSHTWLRNAEAVAYAQLSYSLRPDAVIVIVGAFLGGSTVLLAEPCKLRGSGACHVVDVFEGSGDAFSRTRLAPSIRRSQARFPRA